mmetsp:Transcript_14534/g.24156  ORF Transcript_14534/g.24156 Transcript_14534/m.24156 type:complete len:225 (+) Transcript_14534:1696-2370(+)
MTNRPGITISKGFAFCKHCVCVASVSFANCVTPICCVMPPASPSCTFVCLILSSSDVLPVSTWPMIQEIGARKHSIDRAARASFSLCTRARREFSLRIAASRSFASSSACSRSSSSFFLRSSSSRFARSMPNTRSFSCSFRFSTSSWSSTSALAASFRSAEVLVVAVAAALVATFFFFLFLNISEGFAALAPAASPVGRVIPAAFIASKRAFCFFAFSFSALVM